jgi:hypothetical protein
MANQSMKAKAETAEGERMVWEGEAMEELDEVEDLVTSTEDDYEQLEGL